LLLIDIEMVVPMIDRIASRLAGYRPQRKYEALFWSVVVVCLFLGGTGYLARSVDNSGQDLVINELVASNGAGLVDEDGDFSDWIELYNPTNTSLNLSGWALTDDPNQPQKWTFPDVTIGSGEYLVVFASGKDRQATTSSRSLHTNFRLDRSGDFVGLYRILDQQFSDTLSPTYPTQLRDTAYGRVGHQAALAYLENPTPGAPNDESVIWEDVSAGVDFSVERGFYDQPFEVALSTTTAGATIRYTTDGSEPAETHGMFYSKPIPIETTTVLRAAAFKPNYRPAQVDTHSYIFLDQVVAQPLNPPGFPNTWGTHPSDLGGYTVGAPVIADYAMDRDIVRDSRQGALLKEGLVSIPSLSLVTNIRNFDIYANPRKRGLDWERPVSVELILPDDRQPGLQIDAGLRIHGGESRWEYIPKHSFRLLFKAKYGASKLEYPLFPNSPLEEFDRLVLRGGVSSYAGKPFTDHKAATYTRDEWLRASQVEMSGVGAHGIFVHLYLNGLYWGLYNLTERIDESFMAAYLGGDEEEWSGVSSGGAFGAYSQRFEDLIQLAAAGHLAEPDRYSAISSYLDTTQFIDYVLLNWYAGNRDWPGNNWNAGVRNPAGQVNFFAWDGENSWLFGTKVYLGQAGATADSNPVKLLFEALIQNPDFKLELADRAYQHLFNEGALTDANSQRRWREINNLIDPAIVGESARWGDVRFDQSITRDDWLKARDRVRDQMEGNAARLIEGLRAAEFYPSLDPPVFNKPGGLVGGNFSLSMRSAAGGELPGEAKIYFTLDGSDPRMAVSGALGPGATLYNAPIVLTTTTRVKARMAAVDPTSASTDLTWSALAEADFIVVERESELHLTEIMYNPPAGNEYEFIELKNNGDSDFELANSFFEGIH
jgi:hypothetical protein